LKTFVGRDEPTLKRSVVDHVEDYTKSVAGVEAEAIRTGIGTGSNTVMTVTDARYVVTSSHIRFPMMLRTTIGDDRVVIGHVVDAPPGARWCNIDLTPGAVVAYGPGAEHTGVSIPGLSFIFVASPCDELGAIADTLEVDIVPPPRGEVHQLGRSEETDAFAATLRGLVGDAALSGLPLRRQGDEVLRAIARTLTVQDRVHRIGNRRGIDNRRLVHQCLDYAHSVDRIPSIRELCQMEFVSERRLRQAFVDQYGLSPMRFFRAWALEEARRRLLNADASDATVSRIAAELGIAHFGRFSRDYRSTFGEFPSATLRARAQSRRALAGHSHR